MILFCNHVIVDDVDDVDGVVVDGGVDGGVDSVDGVDAIIGDNVYGVDGVDAWC